MVLMVYEAGRRCTAGGTSGGRVIAAWPGTHWAVGLSPWKGWPWVLDGNQCWLLRNVQGRKELLNSPTARVPMPHSCACPMRISSSIPPVTSSQHRSCLSQQLEMPLSEYNCISAERPQSQWIIWHHRPWWIISDHMPWKTHIPY